MKRHVLIAALLLATTASAAETKPPAKKSAPAAKEAATKKGPAPAANKELRQAKTSFMAAVGACARPEQCDPSSRNSDKDAVNLLKETEETFMTACQACSTQEKCEKEAARIRDGKRSFGDAPCGGTQSAKK